jgi:hypothetical protein
VRFFNPGGDDEMKFGASKQAKPQEGITVDVLLIVEGRAGGRVMERRRGRESKAGRRQKRKKKSTHRFVN